VSEDEGNQVDDEVDDDEDEPNGNLADDAYDDEEEEDDDESDEGNRVPAASAQAVLDYLARAVVSDPDGVEIDVEQGNRGITLAVRVSDGDLGRVIGRRGRVANAIRTIVRAAAVNDGVEVDVDFRD
jgi:hypothetical protein